MTCEEFYEQYFYQILFDVKDVFHKAFLDKSRWNSSLESLVSDYFHQLNKVTTPDLPVESVHISLLKTSFFTEILTIQVDSNSAQGSFLSESILSVGYELGSIEQELSSLQRKWILFTEEEGIQHQITVAYLQSLILSCFTSVFRYFITEYRYHLKKIFEQEDTFSLPKTNKFFVQLGEYQAWKKMIFALRPDCDLLVNEKDTLWNFTHYEKKEYKGETFEKMDISWGVFEHCTFEHCVIRDFKWTDCKFQHCTFHNVVFENGAFHGSTWIQSMLLKCIFQGTDFFQTDLENKADLDRYQSCSFQLCHMNACKFSLCHLGEVQLLESSVTNTEIEICVVKNSDFESLSLEEQEVEDGLF